MQEWFEEWREECGASCREGKETLLLEWWGKHGNPPPPPMPGELGEMKVGGKPYHTVPYYCEPHRLQVSRFARG